MALDSGWLKATAVFLFFFLPLCPSYLGAATPEDPDDYDEETVISRIKNLQNDVVPPQYNEVVRSYILTYTQRKREAAQRIVGRSVIYFPMFEEYLRRRNLPEDLKYLSVVESALDPVAVSRAGAVGLWQFMPSTAHWIGLEINNYVDERCDPHRSTEAALSYLADLYDRFGDWELAIAAYNGGGGRVSRAIKRARSKDFWKIRRYLPRETSNYVPAFIAAYYLLHHYEDHDLVPEYPDLDLQLTKTIKVYSNYSFYEIAQITALPLDVIEALNPSYRKNLIPERAGGRYLTLPTRVMGAFEEYVKAKQPDPLAEMPLVAGPVFVTRPNGSSSDYVKTIYLVREGDSLEKLAAELNCSVHQIRAWNKLTATTVIAGQKLILYHPKEFKRFTPLKKMDEFAPLATRIPFEVSRDATIWVTEQRSFVTKGGYLYYYIQRPERVFELAQRLPGITVSHLMQLNGFKSGVQKIKVDSYVRVKKL